MIQIATLGITPKVVMEGLRKELPEKLYIIHTENVKGKPKEQVETYAKELKKEIESLYKIQVFLLKVDKYDSSAVIGSILDTIQKERDKDEDLDSKDFAINITGGTKAMVAGAACAAYLAQTKMYYVLLPEEARGKQLVRELPVPARAKNDTKGDNTKTTSIILQKILELSPTNNKRLLEKLGKIEIEKFNPDTKKTKRVSIRITPQQLSYHLKKLDDAGYITKTRGWIQGKKKNDKLNTLVITETGKYYAYYPEIIGVKL